MEVTNINDVRIYNLSCGRSLPEWLSDRKKRQLLRKDNDLRKRIELIQDFKMPSVSSCVRVSRDGQYVVATGLYKPRVRCFDVHQLALKFERCFDSEVIKFEILSDDFSKMVFLQVDRYLELHSQFGRYFRLRMPKVGRDIAYNLNNCDLYCVGDSSEVFRLNLEQGRFLNSFKTDCPGSLTCAVNPFHQLFFFGSTDGRLEAWDPRSEQRVGTIDCASVFMSVDSDCGGAGLPGVTKIACKDALNIAVGSSTGLISLYDIRASKPYLTKDHLYGLPIKDIEFLPGLDIVASMDAKVLKLWHRSSGDPYTALQTESDLNDLCVIPRTGMFFLANEGSQIMTYYVPSLGPAPKWCSFLDHMVEEMEESTSTGIETLYDDYKFVTEHELETLGLSHLIGTNFLRAHMHGFFMDIRLYHKAKASSDPFAYEEYKRKKIRERLEAERADRVKINSKLPKVNRDLAKKLLESEQLQVEAEEDKKSRQKSKSKPDSLLIDDRFKAMFQNPDYQIDETTDEYKLLQPMVKKLDKKKVTLLSELKISSKDVDQSASRLDEMFEEVVDDVRGQKTTRNRLNSSSSSSESEVNNSDFEENDSNFSDGDAKDPNNATSGGSKSNAKVYQLKDGQVFAGLTKKEERKVTSKKKTAKLSLADRLKQAEKEHQSSGPVKQMNIHGNRVMTFLPKTRKDRNTERLNAHLKERSSMARSASAIKGNRALEKM